MKRTMRPRFLLISMIYSTILAVLAVLLAACSTPTSTVKQTEAQSNIWEKPAGRAEAQVDAGTNFSTVTEPAAPQETPAQDVPALLERHCAQCHLVQSLQQFERSRSDWEKALAEMGKMGVQLDEAEKLNLLNYLSTADEP